MNGLECGSLVFLRDKFVMDRLNELILGRKPPAKKTKVVKQKVNEEELLLVSTRYFYLGFALLPWIWLINYFYLAPITRDNPSLDKKIKQNQMFSLYLSLIFLIIFVAWVASYLVYRYNLTILTYYSPLGY